MWNVIGAHGMKFMRIGVTVVRTVNMTLGSVETLRATIVTLGRPKRSWLWLSRRAYYAIAPQPKSPGASPDPYELSFGSRSGSD